MDDFFLQCLALSAPFAFSWLALMGGGVGVGLFSRVDQWWLRSDHLSQMSVDEIELKGLYLTSIGVDR